MEIPNNFYRTALKALIVNEEEKILLCLEHENWDFPGGAIEFGESVEESLTREIMEEAELTVVKIAKKPRLFLVFQNIRNYWSTNALYEVEVDGDELNNKLKDGNIRFYSKEEIKKIKYIYPSVLKFIEMLEEDEK